MSVKLYIAIVALLATGAMANIATWKSGGGFSFCP